MITNLTLRGALGEVIKDLQTILLWIKEDRCKHLNVINNFKGVGYCCDCKTLVEKARRRIKKGV